MFRKIVSNLHFSPALVGQLGFYARRLRKEEATRRLGLIFTALALVVQSLAVFSPPEAANAASSADFVRGGVSSQADFLRYYDKNSNDIKSIFSSLGITRAEIANTKVQKIKEPGHYNWSLTSLYSYAQGQRSWSYDKPSGGKGTVYYRPMELTQEGGPIHTVFAGYSKAFGWFAIKKDCGNLITSKPPRAPQPAASCADLAVQELSRTRFRFKARSTDKNGAKIKGYTYEVKNKDGKTVDTLRTDTTKNTDSVTYSQDKDGKYHVILTVRTSEGQKSNKDCHASFIVVPPTPVVICKGIRVDIANRTIVSLAGYANAKNGAKINEYHFVVKNDKDKVIKRLSVKSHKESVSADSFTLTKAGKYSALLRVDTSTGTVSDKEDCVKNFKIAKSQVCTYNPNLPDNSPDCQPCPDNPDIWIKDEDCKAVLVQTKTATNMSQGNVNATTVMARAGDKISYQLTVLNKGQAKTTTTLTESMEDVLEYARLIDIGGGSYDKETKSISWSEIELAAGDSQSRTIAVQLLSTIPATNTGTSNAASYDCTMVNTFGNAVSIPVSCPNEKVVVENVVKELPHTGPRENMIFASVLLAVVVYFYARSRQLGKEVRLIRRGLNAGTI